MKCMVIPVVLGATGVVTLKCMVIPVVLGATGVVT